MHLDGSDLREHPEVRSQEDCRDLVICRAAVLSEAVLTKNFGFEMPETAEKVPVLDALEFFQDSCLQAGSYMCARLFRHACPYCVVMSVVHPERHRLARVLV